MDFNSALEKIFGIAVLGIISVSAMYFLGLESKEIVLSSVSAIAGLITGMAIAEKR